MNKIIKVLAIASNKNMLKGNDESWYHIDPKMIPETLQTGAEIEITYHVENGYKKVIEKINPIKVVKNQIDNNQEIKLPPFIPKQNDDSTVRRIMKGNCLNAAAYALSGTEPDPDILAEKILRLANKLLEWLEI
jgi:hypothetical protein